MKKDILLFTLGFIAGFLIIALYIHEQKKQVHFENATALVNEIDARIAYADQRWTNRAW